MFCNIILKINEKKKINIMIKENIFFLGSGSGFSSLPNTSLLLNLRNTRVLIDFGFTGLNQLRRYKISPQTIDALIITHLHSDHTGGIEMLTYIHKFQYQKKLLLILPNFELQFMLWDMLKHSMRFSPKGIMKKSDYFDIKIAQCASTCRFSTMRFKSHKFTFVKTKHVPGMLSYGVIFAMNGKRVFYTSDTAFDPELLAYVNENYTPSLIIHDCKTDHEDEEVHATYKQIATLPLKLKRKILLIHYDDNYSQIDPKLDGFIGFAQTGEKIIP